MWVAQLLRFLRKVSRRNPTTALLTISGSLTLIGVGLYRLYLKSPHTVNRHLISFTELLFKAQRRAVDLYVQQDVWTGIPREVTAASGPSEVFLAYASPQVVTAHQGVLQTLTSSGSVNIAHAPPKTISPLKNFAFIVLSSGAAALVAGLLLRATMPGSGSDNGDSWNPHSKHSRSARDAHPPRAVTFAGVAGLAGPKRELAEPVAYLQSARRSAGGAAAGGGGVTLADLGGRPPRGVMLAGPPGCGKTMLARAVAGEAGVPFFAVSGSEFVELFVGRGAARVRDLFRRARACAPCVVFVDELDALGKRRGGPLNSDEREATLNQLLVELDGLTSGGPTRGGHGSIMERIFADSDSDEGEGGGSPSAAHRAPRVLVLAATNRVDVLDPALVRPGRFDRIVRVPLPDTAARGGVLDIHMKRLMWASPSGWGNVRAQIVANTGGANAAQLEAIANETAVMAQRRGARGVSEADAVAAMNKILEMARNSSQAT